VDGWSFTMLTSVSDTEPYPFIVWSATQVYLVTTTTILRPFVRDYPGEPVPEETLTHPPSWSASNLYQLLPSTTIHSILPVQITCLAIFLHNLSTSSSLPGEWLLSHSLIRWLPRERMVLRSCWLSDCNVRQLVSASRGNVSSPGYRGLFCVRLCLPILFISNSLLGKLAL